MNKVVLHIESTKGVLTGTDCRQGQGENFIQCNGGLWQFKIKLRDYQRKITQQGLCSIHYGYVLG